MGILDGLLSQLGDNADVANLAAKVGLSPEHVESDVAALAKFHPMDVDTAEGASAERDGGHAHPAISRCTIGRR